MMWILCAGFGIILLLFFMRKFVRHVTSLGEYRRKLEAAEARMQRELEKDLRKLPVSETLAPVASGLREIIELHGTDVPCQIHVLGEPVRIEAHMPSGVIVIQYRRKPAGRERSGCYWEARTPDGKIHVCRDLQGLMSLAEQLFEAEGCITKILI